MSSGDAYELVVTPPAARAIAEHLPEAVATAVVELLTGTLVREPRRVGKPLRRELAGVWSARRGTYRILYRVLDDTREVIVLRVEHRERPGARCRLVKAPVRRGPKTMGCVKRGTLAKRVGD